MPMSAQGTPTIGSDSAGAAVLRVSNTRRWVIVELLFLASLINYFDRATISFALPLISKDLNLGPEAKGFLLSAFFWSYALMQIPLGTCADRFNLRWLYAGALTLWSVAQGLTGFAGSLALLVFFRIILGIGEAIYLVGGTKVVSLFFPISERGFPCGLFDFGTRTGLVLEGLILPWMLDQFGWRATFAFVGFAALLWLIPWFWIFPARIRSSHIAILPGGRVTQVLAANGAIVGGLIGLLTVLGYLGFLSQMTGGVLQSRSATPWIAATVTSCNYALVGAVVGLLASFIRGAGKRRDDQAPELARVKVPEPSASSGVFWQNLGTALRNKDMLGVLLGFFCFDYYWYLLLTWLPDYLFTVRKLTILKAGFYSSLPFLVFGVCQPLGGWIADRMIRAGYDPTLTRKGIISASFLTGLLLIPAAYASTAEMTLVLIMGGCLVGLSTANQLVILQDCAPPEQVGMYVGIYNFVGNLAGIIAPIITGFLIQMTGSYTPAFVVAALMIAAGQLSYWFIVGRLKHRE
ncbi:MAG: MFS transporter [Verrucomicrobia bacterium]|nr:MFS transporter [Verrucomicrobiota bacterium]